ncbi:1-aminocyclopropane-1-carboxylate deaminase/D-cysteine desulfhydrase [Rurimicrobium arvi]|uniref:Pyridoxal-phosphate dependent enzyme n=1 Tax=Rurimicrobium arvi TaxID=2049916 RepID=A0ABP8MZU5_9BACT
MAIIKPVDESLIRIDALPAFDPVHRVAVSMLRLDRMHPFISGNKWYKLSLNLQTALDAGYRRLLTFGGAYSNHLIAAAAAAQTNDLQITGVVRGAEFAHRLNPVLQACADMGMQLAFVSREEYDLREKSAAVTNLLHNTYLIPEGGANEAGRKGAGQIASLIPGSFSHICVSVGSGTTFEGLRNALPASQRLMGYVPIKGGRYLETSVRSHLDAPDRDNWQLSDAWAMGGFGKCPPELNAWMQSFNDQYGIELDRVYTAKMMFGLQAELTQGAFPVNARILCIHTGGLTGNVSNI